MRKTLGVSLFAAIFFIGVAFNPVPVQAGVSASPTSLNFGSVTVNTASAPATLTITNSSRQNMSIGGLSSSLPVFSISGPAFPLSLRARTSATFQVRFTPLAAVAYSGRITIVLNHMFGLTQTISVSGTGAAAPAAPTYLLSASATSLSLGNILVGSSAAQPVTFTNVGTGNVSISQAAISGAGFSVAGFSGATTLAPGQILSLSVAFKPDAAGSATGSLSVVSNATNSPAAVALSGAGVQPQISVSPASIAFPNLIVGQSNSQTLSIRNSGTANLTVSQATISGVGLNFSGLALPLTLAPGASSSFSVAFAPTAAGAVSGSLSLTSNAPAPPLAVALSGTGVAQSLQLTASPTSLSFGNLAVGSTASQSVTLSNTGNASVSVAQISVSGSGFSTSGIAFPLTLAASQTAQFSVTFVPTTAGSLSATATVTSNATNSPASISLTGSGVQPQISVTPANFAFGNVISGVTSTQTLTIQNPGTANLTVSQASISGAGLNFSGLALPLTLAPGASSSFTVSFAPTAAGAVSGILSLTSNTPASPLAVALSGTGVAQSLQLTASPTSLSFGNLAVGSTASQSVTLSNTGNASVSVSQISVSGSGFTASGIAFPLTLAAGQTAQFSVTFAPTTSGSLSATATVTSNATNSPASISLAGVGIQPAISVVPSSVAFGSLAVGVTNTQTLTIKNTGTANLILSQANLSGSGFSFTGLTLPLTLAPNASATATLSFTPISAGAVSGTLSLVSNCPYSPLAIAITGTGVAQTLQLSASPTSLSFGSLTDGATASQTVTLSNTGNANVSLSQISVSGSAFSASGLAVPLTLSPGQTAQFSVTFAPTTAGSLSGTATVASNASNSPATVALSGTGAAPASHSVSLNWTPSSSSYNGFNIYRSSQSGGPYTRVNSSVVTVASYTDSSVVSGKTFCYVVTEVGTNGAESSYSNEADALIP